MPLLHCHFEDTPEQNAQTDIPTRNNLLVHSKSLHKYTSVFRLEVGLGMPEQFAPLISMPFYIFLFYTANRHRRISVPYLPCLGLFDNRHKRKRKQLKREV